VRFLRHSSLKDAAEQSKLRDGVNEATVVGKLMQTSKKTPFIHRDSVIIEKSRTCREESVMQDGGYWKRDTCMTGSVHIERLAMI
jgi:hypothetical protein